jgi:hypothetical protein
MSGDVPLVGDVDGDGRADLIVWRPSTGTFLVKTSSSNYTSSYTVALGENGDVPLVGDVDGDGRADFVVWHVEKWLGGAVSDWIMAFEYWKPIDAPSNDAYHALSWVRDHSSQRACVFAFDTWNSAIGSVAIEDISGRVFIPGNQIFSESLVKDESPMLFRADLLNRCGGDVYIVTGVRPYVGQEDLIPTSTPFMWGGDFPYYELRFLRYVQLMPKLFPEAYSVGGIRVFHITQSPISQSISKNRIAERTGDEAPLTVASEDRSGNRTTGRELLRLISPVPLEGTIEHLGHWAAHWPT